MPENRKIAKSQNRQIPHDLDAERAVLGSILLDASLLDVALDTLAREDFFSQGNRLVWDGMLGLVARNATIDLVTLTAAMRDDLALEKAGGASGLAALLDGVPAGSRTALKEYCGIVREKSLQRRILNAARNVVARTIQGTDGARALADFAVAEFLEIDARDSGAARSYQQAAKDLLEALQGGKLKRVFVGIGEVDKTLGGFLPGELVLYTAETGVGKTLLAAQTRRRACKDGLHTLFASGEMDAEHLLARELATATGVEHWKMRQPEHLEREDWKSLTAAARHQCDRCKILDGELTMGRIAAAARRMKAEGGVDLVVIDYDELVEAPGREEIEQQAAVARGAKSLAATLGPPVILISQLRKLLTGEDRKRPSISRLYGSGAKAKHASIILYVNRDYVQAFTGPETKAEIFILKSRDGRTGKKDCYFNIQSLTFADVEKGDLPQGRGEKELDFKEHQAGKES